MYLHFCWFLLNIAKNKDENGNESESFIPLFCFSILVPFQYLRVFLPCRLIFWINGFLLFVCCRSCRGLFRELRWRRRCLNTWEVCRHIPFEYRSFSGVAELSVRISFFPFRDHQVQTPIEQIFELFEYGPKYKRWSTKSHQMLDTFVLFACNARSNVTRAFSVSSFSIWHRPSFSQIWIWYHYQVNNYEFRYINSPIYDEILLWLRLWPVPITSNVTTDEIRDTIKPI